MCVRLYLPFETPPQEHSWAQIESAQANGCSVSGYLWLYRDADPVATAGQAIACAMAVGLTLPILWVDLEVYTDGSVPSVASAYRCLDAIEAQGVRAGVYTSAWMMRQYFGNTEAFSRWPCWSADYDGNPELDVLPYCGWQPEQIVGKQFSVDGFGGYQVDRDVFRSDYT